MLSTFVTHTEEKVPRHPRNLGREDEDKNTSFPNKPRLLAPLSQAVLRLLPSRAHCCTAVTPPDSVLHSLPRSVSFFHLLSVYSYSSHIVMGSNKTEKMAKKMLHTNTTQHTWCCYTPCLAHFSHTKLEIFYLPIPPASPDFKYKLFPIKCSPSTLLRVK